MSRDGQTREGSPPLQTPSPLEWGVALAGLVVVAGAVIYLLAYAALGAQGPPLMSLAKVSAAPMGEAYALRFEARNDGGATAANVQLSAPSSSPAIRKPMRCACASKAMPSPDISAGLSL
ncbi:MAG TPA: hypothetical protein PKB04_04760 [Phenylobacterium sp.]|nr:hypothetical protein [Phenylobacterium sp.]